MSPNMRDTLQWLRDRGVIVGYAPLDCGHPPTDPRPQHTTGYATTPDEKRVCFACAHEREKQLMRTSESIVLYLTGQTITTWTGDLMARVTSRVQRKMRTPRGYPHTRVFVRAIDGDGRHWHGSGPGDGMYIRLHATRPLTQPTTKRGV
jgi:hypothetical protein